MKNKIRLISVSILLMFSLTACGSDPQLTKFKNDMDDFCTAISEIDSAINNLDAESDTAAADLLDNLDLLDERFKRFAELDFPEEFDYLEELADESSQYMSEAVSYYHEAYSNDSYNEYTAEYAKENYARAYKRIQIIITFLHGEQPENVDLSTEGEE